MPVSLDIDHHLQKTRVIVTGDITFADIRSHLDEEGGRAGLGYRELVDASQATAIFSSEDARRIVEILKNLGRKGMLGPTAVILSNDLTYGMIRMVGVLLEDVCELQAFRVDEREKAEEWLAATPIAAQKQSGHEKDA